VPLDPTRESRDAVSPARRSIGASARPPAEAARRQMASAPGREGIAGRSPIGSQRAALDSNRGADRVARRAEIGSGGGTEGATRAPTGERGSTGDSSRSLTGRGARAPREGASPGSGQDGERFVARRPVDGGSGPRGGVARGTPFDSTRRASPLAHGDGSAR